MNPNDLLILAELAGDLDRFGLFGEANLLDLRIKTALVYQSPDDLAESLTRIVHHLMMRANPEKHAKYLESVRRNISKINPLELAQKNANPSTSIGAAINVVKNILIGQHPAVIAATLSKLQVLL